MTSNAETPGTPDFSRLKNASREIQATLCLLGGTTFATAYDGPFEALVSSMAARLDKAVATADSEGRPLMTQIRADAIQQAAGKLIALVKNEAGLTLRAIFSWPATGLSDNQKKIMDLSKGLKDFGLVVPYVNFPPRLKPPAPDLLGPPLADEPVSTLFFATAEEAPHLKPLVMRAKEAGITGFFSYEIGEVDPEEKANDMACLHGVCVSDTYTEDLFCSMVDEHCSIESDPYP